MKPTGKPGVLAIMMGAPKAKAQPAAEEAPPGDLELAAAGQLISAIRAGNPGAVVEAYRALKEACEAAYGADYQE